MPQDKPGSLNARAYVDVVAYLLQANKFPSGTRELGRNPDALGADRDRDEARRQSQRSAGSVTGWTVGLKADVSRSNSMSRRVLGSRRGGLDVRSAASAASRRSSSAGRAEGVGRRLHGGAGRARQAAIRGRCSRCHNIELIGSERGPALKGNAFWTKYENDSLASLFTLMRDTMPRDGGAAVVSDVVKVDILAYILSATSAGRQRGAQAGPARARRHQDREEDDVGRCVHGGAGRARQGQLPQRPLRRLPSARSERRSRARAQGRRVPRRTGRTAA